jgi:signal transduction histidine kinase
MVAATVVLFLIVHVATSTALGVAPVTAARIAVAAVVQGAVTLLVYRLRVGDNNLTPHRPRDLVDLFAASLTGALVAVPIGPMQHSLLGGDRLDTISWVLLSTAYVFVGGACVLLLVQRSPQTEAIATRLSDVYVQLVATAVCLGVVLTFPDVPLTWIMLLPAIWAGMSMGPWTSASYGLTTFVAVVVAQAIPAATAPYTESAVTNLVLLDVLMAAFVFVVLLLSLLRDQRAYLDAEVVQRRKEAVDQAGLLVTVFESINDALVLVDEDGVVQLHNAAADQILGHRHIASEPGTWLRNRGADNAFTYAFTRDDSETGVRMLAVHLADVQFAGSAGVVATVRDVTAEQQRIEELTSFAAVAAHDLKSPLAAVQGWIEVAEDAIGADSQLVVDALAHSRTATGRMSREIDDWLTYNVAREGAVEPEPLELQPAIETIAAAHPGADISVQAPDTVLVDPTLFQHLMTNLVGNAVKYTSPGERPSVSVRSFTGGDPGWVRVYVVDSGIGIPAGEEHSIFEPFRRSSAVRDTYEGSGLGLALCKRIVRRHGGDISAIRNHDVGTTIAVTLPAG